jgi:hypothetical protein
MSKQGKYEDDRNNEDMSWELESKLEPGMLRFLAHVIEDGLQSGLRTHADFIRHFPPIDIMKGLTERPDLRANILVSTTGVRPKIATKKSAESAGEDLQIALNEGETDADAIVSLFHPDDRVRYLDRARLWTYISEPQFWTCQKDKGGDFLRAKSHVAYILDRAIEDRLLTYRDIVDGIGVGTMVQSLPLNELQSVIERALENSHSNRTFTEQDMLRVVPTSKLVDNIALSLIWDRVVIPKVAAQNELITTSGSTHGTSSNAAYSSTQHASDAYQSDQPGISFDPTRHAEEGASQSQST